MKNNNNDWVLSSSINRFQIITKHIQCNLDKLSSDESKLSYIDEMRVKHRINEDIGKFVLQLSTDLGYEKKAGKWVKIKKNTSSGS